MQTPTLQKIDRVSIASLGRRQTFGLAPETFQCTVHRTANRTLLGIIAGLLFFVGSLHLSVAANDPCPYIPGQDHGIEEAACDDLQ